MTSSKDERVWVIKVGRNKRASTSSIAIKHPSKAHNRVLLLPQGRDIKVESLDSKGHCWHGIVEIEA
jgi:hypothetical protein